MSDTRGLFPEVPSEIDFPKDEQRILSFWQARRIFERTIEAREKSSKGTFVFYEGISKTRSSNTSFPPALRAAS